MHYWIENHLWTIVNVPQDHYRLLKPDNTYALGVCLCDCRKIYINEELPSKKYRKVLIHEVTHSFCYEHDVNIPYELEELLCDFVSNHAENIIDTVDLILRKLYEVA